MKASLHPTWYPQARVTCACGNSFVTGSTKPQIRVEICSNCHPLYTGQQKFVDSLGQVDRFVKRMETAKVKQEQRRQIQEARRSKVAEKIKEKPTLKDLLMQVRKQTTT